MSSPIRTTGWGWFRPTCATRPGAPTAVGNFIAQLVGVADEDGILTVDVAEQPDGTGRTLILQG
jgi:hypothetical protein